MSINLSYRSIQCDNVSIEHLSTSSQFVLRVLSYESREVGGFDERINELYLDYSQIEQLAEVINELQSDE